MADSYAILLWLASDLGGLNMNSDLSKYVSRYVVPFYFDYENNGYERLKNHFLNNNIDNKALALPEDGQWLNVGFWENFKSDRKAQAEMDIYSYLPSVFLEKGNKEEKDVSNLGVSFVYKTSGKLFELEYIYKEKNIAFDCKDLGLILLRNGIGFIWYETEFKKGVSIDEYVKFNNEFKELARTHNDKFVETVVTNKEELEKLKKERKVRKEDVKIENKPFCLGEWLSMIISADALGIRFWAERTTKLGDGNSARIPDKALLFQYLFVEHATDQERNNLVFRVANGYDENYNAPEDIDDNLYKPFGNSCFYISNAGMACIAINNTTNADFFEHNFPGKFIRDYFFIYILRSYQSYSCAHYSRLLTKLPADEEVVNKQEMYADRLESLNGQINLFLVKSVFESVSNIHHQNGLYRYGKSALCIEEDIRSLTIGLGALEEMETEKRKQSELKAKEKREEKINLALIVFGFMVVISAWIDGLNLVDWFMNGGNKINLWHIVVSGGIFVLTLYLIIILLRNRK